MPPRIEIKSHIMVFPLSKVQCGLLVRAEFGAPRVSPGLPGSVAVRCVRQTHQHTRLSAPRVPMRRRRFDKAFCILQCHNISKCIVLFDAHFIGISRCNDTAVSVLSQARFPLSRMTALDDPETRVTSGTLFKLISEILLILSSRRAAAVGQASRATRCASFPIFFLR